MTSFPQALDQRVRSRAKAIGRALSQEETQSVEAEVFQDWVREQRYDALIRRIHCVYDREGGLEECIILGKALQDAGDLERLDGLFRGLINRRVKAFRAHWPLAQSGHPGHMYGCARQAAAAMEA